MSDPLISQTLGQYEIVSKLGKGGMATVYRARQVTMRRDVAIKVMSADLATDPEFVARFEREAHVIARLEHPRILPVHDFGHDGELFYLVMRLIEGESLYYRLKRGPLPLKTAARFVGQIGEALDYAHAEGVIHRDLKPNNILIDQWDNLYLVDFGLAKMMASMQNLTQSGTVLGTPAYMAPEQWRGEPVDARTDVYALGIILYEMVAGRTPFESDTPFTLMYKHINDAPPPLRETLPDLPVEVEVVILKALAKNADDRYQSAGAMARAFSEVVRVAGTLPQRVRKPDEQPASAEAGAEAAGAGPQTPLLVAQPEAAQEAEPAIEPEMPAAAKTTADAEPPPPAPPDEIVPLPAQIVPPPPPLPLPPVAGGRKAKAKRDPYGEPFDAGDPSSGMARRRSLAERRGASSALRQAMEAVDQSLEKVVEKAAEAAPPLPGVAGASASSSVTPDAPALRAVQRALPAGEPLIGVIDVRGTTRWRMWKQLAAGGLALNIIGGVLNAGLLSVLGWLAWIFLAVQLFRTWRGEIGQYYLGFGETRVIVLPRDTDANPLYAQAAVVPWHGIERLRLTNRYVLLDVLLDDGEALSVAALLVATGAGGLGDQASWLPGSPVAGLIAARGFEARNL
ncbi:MAG: serine/threonine protein kinase [Anaerolineae bacterium]|nr:serine/threonine protein kinase [Anaerolineae bacterium]MEB2288434.1 serine/threonine-protein kinase [Anaerolineae bacterium]